MNLVGFIIRICHVARSSERQIKSVWFVDLCKYFKIIFILNVIRLYICRSKYLMATIYEKWAPVTTAFCAFRLRVEEPHLKGSYEYSEQQSQKFDNV